MSASGAGCGGEGGELGRHGASLGAYARGPRGRTPTTSPGVDEVVLQGPRQRRKEGPAWKGARRNMTHLPPDERAGGKLGPQGRVGVPKVGGHRDEHLACHHLDCCACARRQPPLEGRPPALPAAPKRRRLDVRATIGRRDAPHRRWGHPRRWQCRVRPPSDAGQGQQEQGSLPREVVMHQRGINLGLACDRAQADLLVAVAEKQGACSRRGSCLPCRFDPGGVHGAASGQSYRLLSSGRGGEDV